MNALRTALVTTALLAAGTAALAADFVVDAKLHSTAGSAGMATIALTLGQGFSVSVDPTDLWNAGALPRWSNADGLSGNLLATGSDDSGALAGTLIGQNFGLYHQGGLSAPFGTLVGQINSGNFFVVGTNYNGVAADTGTLKLFYFDSNSGDNSQFVTARVSAVPEPAAIALMLAGLVGVGAAARRRAA